MSKKPSKPQNDYSSSVISIDKLAIEAKEQDIKNTMRKYEADNIGLSISIDKLLKELENKENEIDQLKRMLGQTVPIFSDLNLTSEQIIAEKQISRLKDISALRELTLDEAKRLDIFVKVKHTVKEPVKKEDASSLPKDVTNSDLILIASGRKKVE